MTNEQTTKSGHIGINHKEVVDLYVGRHELNYYDRKENKMEEPKAWGYRLIAKHFGCSTQNIRRHIKSEEKHYLDENGEPVKLHDVFPTPFSEPTVARVETQTTAVKAEKETKELKREPKTEEPEESEDKDSFADLDTEVREYLEEAEFPEDKLEQVTNYLEDIFIKGIAPVFMGESKFGEDFGKVKTAIITVAFPKLRKNANNDKFDEAVAESMDRFEYDYPPEE
jgi:hypothetical protein